MICYNKHNNDETKIKQITNIRPQPSSCQPAWLRKCVRARWYLLIETCACDAVWVAVAQTANAVTYWRYGTGWSVSCRYSYWTGVNFLA